MARTKRMGIFTVETTYPRLNRAEYKKGYGTPGARASASSRFSREKKLGRKIKKRFF